MSRNLVVVSIMGLVAGLFVGAVAASGAFRSATEDDNFTLKDQNGQCPYDLKQDGFVLRGNNLKFRFHNGCTSEVTVAMGNVRAAQSTTYADCTNATEGGTAWPFKSGDDQASNRQVTVPAGKTRAFTLHDARTPGSYYFSVCIANTVVDPRLVIE